MALHPPVQARLTASRRGTTTRRGRRVTAGLATGMLLFAGIGVASPPPVSAGSGLISGTVYRDLDNDGIRDFSEPGVPGVVISTGATTSRSDASGAWSIHAWGPVDVRVSTGWYRSQCGGTECSPGPGSDQHFSVTEQAIEARNVDASAGVTLNLGLLPDWRGGYPAPPVPVPHNTVDIAARISWIPPTNAECARTAADDRACLVADAPQFLLQIFNEGTTRLIDPSGYLQLPAAAWIDSLTPGELPGPDLGRLTLGSMDRTTRRVPFTMHGNLAAAASAELTLTLSIRRDARTNAVPVDGPYPNQVGLRMTSVLNDPDSGWCAPGDTTCPWGSADTQRSPDNSDIEGFSIVSPAQPPVTTTTTTVPPTTSTVPPTTSTVPTTSTTVPSTTTLPATTSTTSTSTTSTTSVPTTTSTTTTTVPTPTCSVSNLLVPSCGAWLGSSTPAKDGTYDLVRGLSEYEAVARNTPDIIHLYKTGGGAFPSKSDIALTERPGKARSLLLINWKPDTSLTWRQVADGGADANIATVAAGLKAYPHRLFLTVQHEPENDLQGVGSGRTPTDYAAMYRYVVTRLRSLGVTNVVYVWTMMGSTNHAPLYPTLYPGDDVVDWIAYDPYGQEKQTTMGELVNRPGSGWPGFYSWATDVAPGKPIMLAEWGFNLAVSSYGPAALDGGVPILQSQFPMLKALVYWNQNFTFKARLDQPGALGQAYGEAYGRFANQPYFNATSTAMAT